MGNTTKSKIANNIVKKWWMNNRKILGFRILRPSNLSLVWPSYALDSFSGRNTELETKVVWRLWNRWFSKQTIFFGTMQWSVRRFCVVRTSWGGKRKIFPVLSCFICIDLIFNRSTQSQPAMLDDWLEIKIILAISYPQKWLLFNYPIKLQKGTPSECSFFTVLLHMHWQFLLGTSVMAMSLLCNHWLFLLGISAMAQQNQKTIEMTRPNSLPLLPPWGVQSRFFLFFLFLVFCVFGFLISCFLVRCLFFWRAGKTTQKWSS